MLKACPLSEPAPGEALRLDTAPPTAVSYPWMVASGDYPVLHALPEAVQTCRRPPGRSAFRRESQGWSGLRKVSLTISVTCLTLLLTAKLIVPYGTNRSGASAVSRPEPRFQGTARSEIPKPIARRRLKVSDINVVNQPMLKKAL
jgi:hypothetical protein